VGRAVALVTGAGGGVGAAVVAEMVGRGMAVVAEDSSSSVRVLEGPDVRAVQGDIRDPSTAQAAVAAALGHFGRLDVVVNNAAVFLSSPIADTSDDDWDRVMAVNTKGVFLHTREALAALKESPCAAIVNIASISGLIGIPRQFVYSATKGAVVQMTRVSAIELAPHAIRVNAVAPGAIDTSFTAEMLAALDDVEAYRRSVSARHPRGQMSSPAEVAKVVGFLASAESVSMTGAIVPVDGGYTAQ